MNIIQEKIISLKKYLLNTVL